MKLTMVSIFPLIALAAANPLIENELGHNLTPREVGDKCTYQATTGKVRTYLFPTDSVASDWNEGYSADMLFHKMQLTGTCKKVSNCPTDMSLPNKCPGSEIPLSASFSVLVPFICSILPHIPSLRSSDSAASSMKEH